MSLLSLSGVCKSHWHGDDEIRVLDKLDLELDAGELVGVWGAPGTGRTTLLRIAAGLDAPTGGTVSFCERDLATFSPEERLQLWQYAIGWADGEGPGDKRLTMLDYVSEPLFGRWDRPQARGEAARMLARVGLRDSTEERWEDLTDVERALAQIAHALVRLPKLLVLDDLTAELRMREREYVMDLLRSAAEGACVGVLITTPSTEDLLYVHRIAWLSDGQLLEPRARHAPHSSLSG